MTPIQLDKGAATELLAQIADAAPAARVTPEQIDALDDTVQLLTHHFPGTSLTIAVAVLPDGFVLSTGHSSCISPANFNAEIGSQRAKVNAMRAARDKLWELEGYLLRDRIRAMGRLLKPASDNGHLAQEGASRWTGTT